MSVPNETAARLLLAAVTALGGAGVGWAAQALTLAGRVEAIERGQQRVEGLLVQLLQAERRQAAAEAPQGVKP